ncbi:unnamed protein product [Brachionus calyciflorus]|uniref:Homeobox domain-containing protein n=1 Tax=Brachionus calyciflorus TaxID=104777 RepID=A0A813RRN4_9BILA|nr:unnamed protein product [Brachionus calyciflorus]
MYYQNYQEYPQVTRVSSTNANNYGYLSSFYSPEPSGFSYNYQNNSPFYTNYNYDVNSSSPVFSEISSNVSTISQNYYDNIYNQSSLNSSDNTNSDIEGSLNFSLNNLDLQNYNYSLNSSPLNPNLEKNYQTPNVVNDKSTKATRQPRKQLLPDLAVDIMNDWFEDHINNPYPTLDEKEKMAKQAGITVKQVTAWFSNRRNRSQNTKPKRIKRVIEHEINQIFNELSYNSNSGQILEKFRKTLLNH